MFAPLIWYFFVANMDFEVDRAGGYTDALVNLKNNISPEEKNQLIVYFKYSLNDTEEGCRLIQAEGIEEKIYFEPHKGSCHEMVREILEIFET